MLALYSLIVLMSLIAISIMAIPFLKYHRNRFSLFFIFSFALIICSLALYQFTGNSTALNEWLTKGKNHYALLVQYNKLGGIDGIINRIQARLKIDPNDAKGWFILGKLYLMKNNIKAAKPALEKAHQLQPENTEINRLLELTRNR